MRGRRRTQKHLRCRKCGQWVLRGDKGEEILPHHVRARRSTDYFGHDEKGPKPPPICSGWTSKGLRS